MPRPEKFVAVALLSEAEVERVGRSLRHLVPLQVNDDFSHLLKAIDEADARRRAGASDKQMGE